MPIKDKLQIILITYNRASFVKRTFEQILCKSSPVLDCEIIVQDNNSTDNTYEVVSEFAKQYPNIKYRKNTYNIGLSGNITKGIESADREYVWIIGDDDVFEFSNWNEVVRAIERKETVICVARYALPHPQDIAEQLLQLTFITGGIYRRNLFTDTTVRNVYDNVYTLFPHMLPVIQFINDGGTIYVCSKEIANNGWNMGKGSKDVSYARGAYKKQLSPKSRDMTWILGYSNVITSLSDKKLQFNCLEKAITFPEIFPSKLYFFNYLLRLYHEQKNYFYDIYQLLDFKYKTIWFFLKPIQYFAACKTENNQVNVYLFHKIKITIWKKN